MTQLDAKCIVAEILEDVGASGGLDTPIDSLGFDSLDLLDFVGKIEAAACVEIPIDVVVKFQTAREVASWIALH